jgi:hypothetical protein
MRRIIISLFFAVTTLFLITSCGKFEEGPKFSLLTIKARLTGHWKLGSSTVNGIDNTSSFGPDYELDIEKNGTYKIKGVNPDDGKWDLGEDKDDVFFASNQPGSLEKSYRILKLKNKEMWLRRTEFNGDKTVMKLKQ